MTKIDWENITNYIDAVGTTDTVFPFIKTQSSVVVKNGGGTANLIYTIGSQSGTLSPGQSITVLENITSMTLRSSTGKQDFQVWATEAGTEKDEESVAPDLTGIQSQVDSLETSLAQKANQTEVRLNTVKLGQADMTDTFLQQMAGTTPINAIPGDFSLTMNKYAPNSISAAKLIGNNIISANLFNKGTVIKGKVIDGTSLQVKNDPNGCMSDYIVVDANSQYTSSFGGVTFFDANFNAISQTTSTTFTTPSNCSYVVGNGGIAYIDGYSLSKGTTAINDTYKVSLPWLKVGDNHYILDTIQTITATPSGSGFTFTFADDSSYGNTMYLYDGTNKIVNSLKLNANYSITVPAWAFLVWNYKTNMVSVVQESSTAFNDSIILLGVTPYRVAVTGALHSKVISSDLPVTNTYNVAFEGIPYSVSDSYNLWIKFDKVIITTPTMYFSATWDTVISQISPIQSGYYVGQSAEWVANTIFLNYKKALVFDLKTNTFTVILLNDKYTNKNYIVIAENQDAKLNGAFAEYYLSFMDKDRNHKTNYVRKDYIDTIESKENAIIPLLTDSTFMFGFSTDMHVQEWEGGHRNVTYNVMNRLRNTLGLDCIINGGDTVSYGRSDITKAYGALKSITNKFDSRDNFYHIVGNHDFNGRSDAPNGKQLKSWTVTPIETYNFLGRHLKDVVWGNKENMYFYKDFTDKKIRVIFLNTSDVGFNWVSDPTNGDYLQVDPLVVGGIRQTQFDWLCNTALNFNDKSDKTEWHTMVIQHIGLYSDAEGLTWNSQNLENQMALRSLLKSFKNGTSINITYTDTKYNGTFNINTTTNFSNQGSMTFIGVWSGHNHLDRIVNSDEIIDISTTCGFPDSTLVQKDANMVRTPFTYSEFALDVVVVDKVQRKVTLTRFGAGNDRSFTY